MNTNAIGHEIVQMTPKKAKDLLANSGENRGLRPKVVAAYRRDMEAGRWEFTGEPIQVSRTGQLLNGQHRLTALANSSGVRSIPLLLVTGLPDESQLAMDQGIPRTIRDALGLRYGALRNLTAIGSLARWVSLNPEGPNPTMNASTMRTKVTSAEALEAYTRYPEMEDIVAEAVGLRDVLPGSPTGISFTYLFAHRLDADAAAEFFHGMAATEFAMGKDPRKAVIKRMRAVHLGNLRGEHKQATSVETGVMMVSVLSRAWNDWRDGNEAEGYLVKSRAGVIPPVTLK